MKLIPALIALVATPLFAHDFWIQPSTFHPKANETVTLQLRVGQNFLGDPLPRMPELLVDFSAWSGGASQPATGDPYDDPAGAFAAKGNGVTVATYVSSGSIAELTPEKFRDYAAQEGLESLLAERQKRGVANKNAIDNFSRCAKAILWGGGSKSGFDHVAGMTLELVPRANPYALHAGSQLPLQLFYRGKPLAGTLVVAIPQSSPAAKVSARTDANGKVILPLARGGAWMIKAVQVVPSSIAPKAEYDSYWASLTFELPK